MKTDKDFTVDEMKASTEKLGRRRFGTFTWQVDVECYV